MPSSSAALNRPASCPLLTAKSVMESTSRPAACASSASRWRSAANLPASCTSAGERTSPEAEFCGVLNIGGFDTVDYTAAEVIGALMALDIAQLLAFAVKNH